MFEFIIQAFVTLFVIINPFAAIPIFVSLTKNDSFSAKRAIAKRSCIISLILLFIFALLGDFLLKTMNISEGAFRITGGFLLLLSAMDMVRSKSSNCFDTGLDASASDVSVFPLAIPFLAGPGAITSVVILMRQARQFGFTVEVALIALLIVMIFITFICLLLSDRLMKIFGITGTNVLTRVFGIVLSAVSIQNIINGVAEILKITL
jgi:multiple antibiotic resistance protein